jgi:hypothetical protein
LIWCAVKLYPPLAERDRLIAKPLASGCSVVDLADVLGLTTAAIPIARDRAAGTS